VLQERPATDDEALLHGEAGAEARMHCAMRSMINDQNNEGETVLMLWACQGNIRMVKKLLEMGADPSLKNRLGNTALDMAAGHDDVIKLLRQHT
jgi:ankyrin repeat protein